METIHKKLLRKTFPCQYSNPWSYHIRNLTTPPPCNSTVNCWMTSFFSNDLHIKLIASNYGFILLFFFCWKLLVLYTSILLEMALQCTKTVIQQSTCTIVCHWTTICTQKTLMDLLNLCLTWTYPYTTNSCMEQLWDRIFLLSQKLWL